MEYFYIVVFLVGVFYTFVSLFISAISGAFHLGGDIGSSVDGHVGVHGHLDGGHTPTHAGDPGHFLDGHAADTSHICDLNGHQVHSSGDSSGLSHSLFSWFAIIINPLVAVSFLTVFGGIGIMGVHFFLWDSIITFVVAIASGFITATVLYNFIAKPIYKSENTSDVSREELIGTSAEVTTDILANGFGTIKYTVNSIMYIGPARHIDEKAVKHGEKVFICKIQDNTFYISEISSIQN